MTAAPGSSLSKTHLLRPTPQTVVWGHISAGVAPALRIASGETVRIDTVSHQGLMREDPTQYFGEKWYTGLSPNDYLSLN